MRYPMNAHGTDINRRKKTGVHGTGSVVSPIVLPTIRARDLGEFASGGHEGTNAALDPPLFFEDSPKVSWRKAKRLLHQSGQVHHLPTNRVNIRRSPSTIHTAHLRWRSAHRTILIFNRHRYTCTHRADPPLPFMMDSSHSTESGHTFCAPEPWPTCHAGRADDLDIGISEPPNCASPATTCTRVLSIGDVRYCALIGQAGKAILHEHATATIKTSRAQLLAMSVQKKRPGSREQPEENRQSTKKRTSHAP